MQIITPNAITGAEGGFSRASTAKYVGADGIIKTAGIDALRVEYDPQSNALLGVLIEGSATNLLLQSQTFDNAAWTKTATAIAANICMAPDGTMTGDKLYELATNAQHSASQSIASAIKGKPYTYSVYAKAAERSLLVLYQSSVAHGGVFKGVLINLATGAISATANGATAKITAHKDGWYRCECTATTTASGALLASAYISTTNIAAAAYLGDGVSGIYTWGAQLEQNDFATSYIDTTAAMATRSADIVLGTAPCLAYCNAVESAMNWSPAISFSAGDRALLNTTRRVYQAISDVPAGMDPPDINVLWKDIGSTDRYAAFDASSGSSTSSAGVLIIGIKPGLADSLALVDMSASQAAIRAYDASGVQTYVAAGRLEDGANIVDAFGYCFSAPDMRSAIVYNDIPPISSQTIWVALSEATQVSVGTIAAGNAFYVGPVRYGAQAGIIDSSIKSTDEFGNTTIVKRPYAKRINVQAQIESSIVSAVARKLSRERATPLIFDGIDGYDAGVIFGFPKEWQIEIAWPTYSIGSFTIEGLA